MESKKYGGILSLGIVLRSVSHASGILMLILTYIPPEGVLAMLVSTHLGLIASDSEARKRLRQSTKQGARYRQGRLPLILLTIHQAIAVHAHRGRYQKRSRGASDTAVLQSLPRRSPRQRLCPMGGSREVTGRASS